MALTFWRQLLSRLEISGISLGDCLTKSGSSLDGIWQGGGLGSSEKSLLRQIKFRLEVIAPFTFN